MMRQQSAVTRGIVLGASAAALWAIARRYGQDAEPRLLDWEWVRRVAIRSSGPAPALHPAARARLQTEYESLLRQIESPLAGYVGQALPLSGISVRVLDREGWITANIANFRDIFQPLDQLAGDARGLDLLLLPGVGRGSRILLSTQLGLLLGFLARRVLGQYDVSLLGRDPQSAGQLYFVEPNIEGLQRTLGVPIEELRAWIALHEATHAVEFEVHPWVRTYLNTTLHGYLNNVVADMRQRSQGVNGSLVMRVYQNLRRGQHLFEAMMTPQQRHLLSRLQALMSLAEGYSNHVMNQVGRTVLPHYGEMKARVERRQKSRGRAEQLLLKLTGLSMKMEQYALGEAFVDRVVSLRGVAFVNRAWASPEHLPTDQELRQPERWIQRLEALAA